MNCSLFETPIHATVAFTGYRPEKMPFPEDPSHEVYRRFRAAEARLIRQLADQGYTHFVSGMARGFDLWVAEDVLALRVRFPELKLICALPFPEQAAGWPSPEQMRWRAVCEQADEIVTVAPAYFGGCFYARNRYMVDRADLLVCAYDGRPGGTAYTVDYARKKGKPSIFIHPVTCVVSTDGC